MNEVKITPIRNKDYIIRAQGYKIELLQAQLDAVREVDDLLKQLEAAKQDFNDMSDFRDHWKVLAENTQKQLEAEMRVTDTLNKAWTIALRRGDKLQALLDK